MREIRIAGMPGGARSETPLQAEALAHFARMTTPPSAAFKTAFNRAVYRWKAAGIWALIKGLWLGCADTPQAALLSVIGDTPRDAVVVGSAPTHAALKGWTGFDATHRIRFPITAAVLENSNQVIPFLAAKLVAFHGDYDSNPGTSDGYYSGPLITGDADASAVRVGNFVTAAPSGNDGVLPSLLYCGNVAFRGLRSCVFGYKQTSWIMPGGYGENIDGSIGDPTSNYITHSSSLGAFNNGGRLVAYGFLGPAATPAQGAKFLSVLANLIDELGALD